MAISGAAIRGTTRLGGRRLAAQFNLHHAQLGSVEYDIEVGVVIGIAFGDNLGVIGDLHRHHPAGRQDDLGDHILDGLFYDVADRHLLDLEELKVFLAFLEGIRVITFLVEVVGPQLKEDALLRSRDNSEQAPIDPRLLDLIDHLQDHFQADAVEIISGYRRKEFNENLLKNGHSVSPVSLHTKGQALDIHIDEIREETLRDYLLGLRLGGVGYYGPLDFVHIDVGPVRRWGEGVAAPRKLVGVLKPEAPVQLTSDKNDYLPGETLLFTWSGDAAQIDRVTGLRLEHFHRGRWLACPSSAGTSKTFRLPTTNLRCAAEDRAAALGKFRWIFQLPDLPEPLSSNEFYLKKE